MQQAEQARHRGMTGKEIGKAKLKEATGREDNRRGRKINKQGNGRQLTEGRVQQVEQESIVNAKVTASCKIMIVTINKKKARINTVREENNATDNG